MTKIICKSSKTQNKNKNSFNKYIFVYKSKN